MLKGIMADLAWFSALFILFCSSPGNVKQPFLFTREREKHFGTFSVHLRLTVLKLARLENQKKKKKKKKKKKEDDDYRFFQT